MTIEWTFFLSELMQNPILLVVTLLNIGVIIVNGATDAPNAIATAVSTRAMKPRHAIIMAAVFNFLGLLLVSLVSTAVAHTIFSMVDFGGWEMPVQYPTGIVAEHLYTRHFCSLFDVSHMGRLLIQGPERLAFLQHVLSSNVAGLDLNMAQYCILPDEDGGAVDDAYLYRFEEERLLLVVNAANTEKDLIHLRSVVKD